MISLRVCDFQGIDGHECPAGAALEGFELKESVRHEAKGGEVHAPVHDYEVKGRGRAIGDAKAVIDFYDGIEHNELLELDEIGLACGKAVAG